MYRYSLKVVFSIAFSFLALLLMVSAEPARAGDDDYAPNWMSYQGYLTDNAGQPFTGFVDVYLAVYDSSEGGQKYWEQYRDNVEVTGGYFYVRMGGDSSPLGYGSFGDDKRYVEVRVASPVCRPACSADGPEWETLPRQMLGAVPYALRAHRAYSATWASQVHWDNIQGKPTEFGGGYKYYVVVAKEGGDYTSLYDAVQSITDAGPDKPYLIYVAPGVYQETETIVTKPYVHIKGAGKHAVYIENSVKDKTIVLQSNVSISYLTVRNYYPGGNSYAIYANAAEYAANPVWLYYVRAYASYQGAAGAYNHYGFYASGAVEVHIYDSYFYAEYGPQYNYGAYVAGGAQIYLKSSHFYGRYGDSAWGIYVTGTGTHLDAYYVKAWGEKATNYNYGLYNYKGATAKLNKGYYRGYYGESAGQYCYGIYNEEATLEAYYVYGYGYQCSMYNYGLYNYYGESATEKSIATVKHGYYKGYKGQDAYGFYNYGSGAELHTHYAYGYGDEASSKSYGLYNSNDGYVWIYDGYYRGYKGQYCYGLFNNVASGSTIEANNASAYGKYCTVENYGLYNKYGTAKVNGGVFYGYAESTGGNNQYCYGIYTGGKDAGGSGQYNGYGVTAWAKNCYYNFGLYNFESGQAESHQSTYYAYDGVLTYGAYCTGTDSLVYLSESTAYGKSGSSANYGYTGAAACHGGLHGGTYYGQTGVDNYGIYCSGTGTQCYAERVSSWGKDGSGKNYGFYNTSSATSKVHHGVLHSACAEGGCPAATKYAMYSDSGDVKAAYTQYDNGSAGGYKYTGGAMKCVGIYDYNYDAVTCTQNP